MNEYPIIETRNIDRLVKEGKIERETLGDSETGRVYINISDKKVFYHQCKCYTQFFIREESLK